GFIIDSFLVVVLGGVGQLAGSVAGAFGLGLFNKILETHIGAVEGQKQIMVAINNFIHKPPHGLFLSLIHNIRCRRTCYRVYLGGGRIIKKRGGGGGGGGG
ncbi:hypothetical protein ACVGWT_00355, partial [Enterobacter hormaechei]